MSEFKISQGDADSYWYLDTATGDVALKHQGVDRLKFKSASALANNGDSRQTVKIDITSAEILALAAAPKELVAAPGADKVVMIESCILQMNSDGGTDYDDAAADGDLQLRYVDGAGVAVGASVDADAFVDAAAEAFQVHVPAAVITATVAQIENTAVVLDNDGTEFTGGDHTMSAYVTYRILDVEA